MMQSNIYAKVAPLLKETSSEIGVSALEHFLNLYQTGKIIYPSAMNRELKIQIPAVYRILESAVDAGVCKQVLEIYCPYCQRFTGLKFESIFDIPDEMNCIHCDMTIRKPTEHAIVVYKVL